MKYPELFVLALDGAVPGYIGEQIEAGKLPNFARAMRRGCFMPDSRPAFPTITPTCWSTLCTGASPEVHGATCQDFHLYGTELDAVATAYSSEAICAERFWESAARIGKKSLILSMPTAGPARSGLVRQFDNGLPAWEPSVPVGFEIPQQLYRIAWAECPAYREAQPGPHAPSGQWQPQFSLKPMDVEADETGLMKLPVVARHHRDNRYHVEEFCWYARKQGDGLLVSAGPDGEGVYLAPGEWSPIIRRKLTSDNGLHEYLFRMKLFYAQDSLALFVSSTYDLLMKASPEDFARRLIDIPGVPVNSDDEFFQHGGAVDTMFECVEACYDWQEMVIAQEMEADPADIVIAYHGFLDEINHFYRPAFEGFMQGQDVAREMYERAYELADRKLGRICERFIGPETTLVIVSDHGGIGYERIIRPQDVLEQAGLLAYDADGRPDWSKTKAFPIGTCHAYVNLKGRDPHGIVEPEDYEATVQTIITALQEGFRDKETGWNALAFAVPNAQAGFVGLGGERCGDVVYGLTGSFIGGYYGGVHACQIPTAKSATGDIRSLCMMSGPAFRENEMIARPVQQTDIAPTICRAMGYPMPAQATGAVVYQALKE